MGMTSEDKIHALKLIKLKIEPPTDNRLGWLETWIHKEDLEAFDSAIKALEQEPTTKNDLEVDCISRADAIKGLGEQPYVWTDSDYEIQQLTDWKNHKEMLENLPSLTPQEPRWIPVSERLPEVNQRVLVTSYGRVCYAMMISTNANSGHPVFKLQDSLNERVVCETTVHNEFTTSRIKAWMPLPEPYKEVRDKE